MFMRTPVHCRPRAYERLHGQLPVIESPEALLEAAAAIAMHEMGAIDTDAIGSQLLQMSDLVRDRIQRVDHVEAVLAHAHEVIFSELGFAGNRDDYYHPDNSYLPRVIETRRGLPITLALVYKLVLEHVGLTVHGINAPGHFLAGVADGPRLLIIDVFDAGRLLSHREAITLIEKVTGQQWPNPDAPLPLATHRQWLTRICANLVHAFQLRGQETDAAAMREMMHLLNLGG